jgi:hypothetical protein
VPPLPTPGQIIEITLSFVQAGVGTGSPAASASPLTTGSPAASEAPGGSDNSTLDVTIDVLPRNETQTLGRGNQLAISVRTATVDLVLNGVDQATGTSPFDGYVSPNFKGGYLTNGNATVNFLCPDLSGGSGGTTTASPAGSPSTEPSGSPSASSSP